MEIEDTRHTKNNGNCEDVIEFKYGVSTNYGEKIKRQTKNYRIKSTNQAQCLLWHFIWDKNIQERGQRKKQNKNNQ